MTGVPFIPENIVVHLGAPDDTSAVNVTVPFTDYIKNAASSEIYPTWPESALRANIYAIITYALNRYYTEWYPSRGYNFDITNDTRYDQSYVYGRDIFEPISNIVDEIFNNYIRRQGTLEPIFSAYCDGVRTYCGGLKQWETVELANQGLTPFEILRHFYGDDIEIVTNAPVSPNIPSYPGEVISFGSAGDNVVRIQTQLNRISQNYPAIPRIPYVTGSYNTLTEDAVRTFQQVFGLPQTGYVDKSTWYRINQIYTGIKRLGELTSEGITITDYTADVPEFLRKGDSGANVRVIQYILSVVGAYYDAVPRISVTGNFGEETENALRAFQQIFGLPETGVLDAATWEDLYRAYKGIVDSLPVSLTSEEIVLFPGVILREGMQNEYVRTIQQYLTEIHNDYPQIPAVTATGYFGPLTKNAVTAFQRVFGINPTGYVGAETWARIGEIYSEVKYGYIKPAGQFPGYTIR